jgi:hypothetical protein
VLLVLAVTLDVIELLGVPEPLAVPVGLPLLEGVQEEVADAVPVSVAVCSAGMRRVRHGEARRVGSRPLPTAALCGWAS